MKKNITLFLFCLFFCSQLIKANIAIIAVNSDGDEELAFVVTSSGGISTGATLFFTDDEYDNATDDWVNVSEGRIQLVTSTNLTQGTIVVLDPTNLVAINANGGASVGTLTQPTGNFNLSNGADPVFAYTTSDNTSVGPIDNICSVFVDDVLIGNENPIPDYPNAIVVELNNDQDNAAYDPANGTSFPDIAAFIADIQDDTNYQLTDGVGGQSINLATLYSGLFFIFPSGGDVPTLSEWGLINLALLLMTFGTLSIIQIKTRSEV